MLLPDVFRANVMAFLDEDDMAQLNQTGKWVHQTMDPPAQQLRALEHDYHVIKRGYSMMPHLLVPRIPLFWAWLQREMVGRGFYFLLGYRGRDFVLSYFVDQVFDRYARSKALHDNHVAMYRPRNRWLYCPRETQNVLRALAMGTEEHDL
jgi:hypothetical protein